MRRYPLAAFLTVAWLGAAFAQSPVEIMIHNAGNATVPVSPSNPMPVSGTFSASLSGFTPGLAYASLTATNASASVALPVGVTVQFQNAGTTTVSCTLGVGSATALANELIVQPGSTKTVVVGSNTFGACIDQTGSASNVVVLAGGSGLGNDSGGGSSSGGGGGAVTIADGADTTLGAKADAVCATATGTCTLEALVKYLNTAVGSAIAAGANLIGKVGIDQTTPGTTNATSPQVNVGGTQTGQIGCGSSVVYDASTSGSTQLVALASSQKVYVCGYTIVAAGTVNVELDYGTGTACATGNTKLTPAYQLTAQVGLVDGSPLYRGLATIASNELCLKTNAAVAVQAIVYYTQF